MANQYISARWLLTGSAVIEHPIIELDQEGTLVRIESGPPQGVGNDLLCPGMFDIHTHGAAGHDVMEGTLEALGTIERFLATRGVAHYLPTTVTAPVATTLHALAKLANRIEEMPRPGHAQPVGIHLEGPFLSHAKRGVHSPELLQAPNVMLFDQMQEAARGQIRLVTVAPETPGAIEFIRHIVSTGVEVSIGHTDATMLETRAAIAAGARSATHTFNAMRPLNHREPGVLGVVLDDERVFAELICDGIHVAPELVRLWIKAKGFNRGILVTDSMSAAGMSDGAYQLGSIEVVVEGDRCLANGVLAGSVLTLDRALLNLCRFTGASPLQAIPLATANPASMLRRPELAELAIGAPANLVRFSPDGVLLGSIIGGKWSLQNAL